VLGRQEAHAPAAAAPMSRGPLAAVATASLLVEDDAIFNQLGVHPLIPQ
jgi:hypothetical protein